MTESLHHFQMHNEFWSWLKEQQYWVTRKHLSRQDTISSVALFWSFKMTRTSVNLRFHWLKCCWRNKPRSTWTSIYWYTPDFGQKISFLPNEHKSCTSTWTDAVITVVDNGKWHWVRSGATLHPTSLFTPHRSLPHIALHPPPHHSSMTARPPARKVCIHGECFIFLCVEIMTLFEQLMAYEYHGAGGGQISWHFYNNDIS